MSEHLYHLPALNYEPNDTPNNHTYHNNELDAPIEPLQPHNTHSIDSLESHNSPQHSTSSDNRETQHIIPPLVHVNDTHNTLQQHTTHKSKSKRQRKSVRPLPPTSDPSADDLYLPNIGNTPQSRVWDIFRLSHQHDGWAWCSQPQCGRWFTRNHSTTSNLKVHIQLCHNTLYQQLFPTNSTEIEQEKPVRGRPTVVPENATFSKKHKKNDKKSRNNSHNNNSHNNNNNHVDTNSMPDIYIPAPNTADTMLTKYQAPQSQPVQITPDILMHMMLQQFNTVQSMIHTMNKYLQTHQHTLDWSLDTQHGTNGDNVIHNTHTSGHDMSVDNNDDSNMNVANLYTQTIPPLTNMLDFPNNTIDNRQHTMSSNTSMFNDIHND